MRKRIPKNAKYQHVKTRLDTGNFILSMMRCTTVLQIVGLCYAYDNVLMLLLPLYYVAVIFINRMQPFKVYGKTGGD